MDGYIRWNNHVTQQGNSFDVWNPGSYGFVVTSAIVVGHTQQGNSSPIDAYVESFNKRIKPVSLYEEQLNRRVGHFPAWLQNVKKDHREMLKSITGEKIYPLRERTSQVQAAILTHYPHVDDVDFIRPKDLKDITTLDMHDKGITSLSFKDFNALTGLHNLTLSSNSISTLPSSLIHDCPIWRLNLSDNNLTSVPVDFFYWTDSPMGIVYLRLG